MYWSRSFTKAMLRGYKPDDWMLVYSTSLGTDEVEPLRDFKPLSEESARWWLHNLRLERFLLLRIVKKRDVKWP